MISVHRKKFRPSSSSFPSILFQYNQLLSEGKYRDPYHNLMEMETWKEHTQVGFFSWQDICDISKMSLSYTNIYSYQQFYISYLNRRPLIALPVYRMLPSLDIFFSHCSHCYQQRYYMVCFSYVLWLYLHYSYQQSSLMNGWKVHSIQEYLDR